jgi:thioesterase domain-containing protein
MWQRLLQRQAIGMDDNFFELGGDPVSASELFAEIARFSGREFSPLTIYQAPTIAKLAAIIEQGKMPRLETVVQLRAGSEGSPVFFLHGAGGTVMEFFQLVKHIEPRRPIFGLQTRGMDGLVEPLDSIEEMAKFYLNAIRRTQPQGPYILVGYSLGGLVALEMARSLLESGERGGLLVMVDSYPHFNYLPLGQKAGVVGRRIKRYAFAKLMQGKGALPSDSSGGAPTRPQFGKSLAPVVQLVSDRANDALLRYRPRLYMGKVQFLKAAISTEFADHPVAAWSKYIAEVEVQIVPGDHFGILATFAPNLGEAISRCLKGAVG